MVVLLVEEIAGLLPAHDVHGEADAVLADDGLLGQRAIEHLREALHALLAADGVIVLQQEAFGVLGGDERVGDDLRIALHAQREDLQHDDGAEAVGDDAGQAVGLAVDEAAGVGAGPLHDEAAIGARGSDAGGDERIGDLLAAVGEQADGDQRAAVVEAGAHVAAAEVDDGDEAAVLRLALDALDFVAVDPGMALQQLFLAAVDDVNDGKRVVHLMIPSFFKIAFTLYHQAGDV